MNWDRVPMWSLYRRVDRSGCPDLPLLSVYRDHGVVRREGREDNYNKPGQNLFKYKVVHKGDLVINKMKTWQGSLGVSSFHGIVSPAYFVAERIGDVDDRFMHHLLRSPPSIAEYGARSKGIRPAQWDLPWDEFASIKVRLPDPGEQRAIADYLDVETDRVDALISKKRRMIRLLGERVKAVRDEWIERSNSQYGTVSLRRLWRRIEQGWSPVCDSEPAEGEEWGVIKTSAVSTGTFVAHNNKRLPTEKEPDMRWMLRDGDLLVTRGSGSRSLVGIACVARVGERNLTLSDLVYRIHLLRTSPDFVAAAMSGSEVRSQIESSIRTDAGLTLKIRRDDLACIRIPAAPLRLQTKEAASLARRTSRLQKAGLLIEKQLELLAERRRALVTAAVTGKLSVL